MILLTVLSKYSLRKPEERCSMSIESCGLQIVTKIVLKLCDVLGQAGSQRQQHLSTAICNCIIQEGHPVHYNTSGVKVSIPTYNAKNVGYIQGRVQVTAQLVIDQALARAQVSICDYQYVSGGKHYFGSSTCSRNVKNGQQWGSRCSSVVG